MNKKFILICIVGVFLCGAAERLRAAAGGIDPSFTAGVFDKGTVLTMARQKDDWRSTDFSPATFAQEGEIAATGIPPGNEKESAIIRMLAPGGYTAIVRGKGPATGIGLVEAYDLDQGANSIPGNIATRGFVNTDNNVMIGGFIIGPGGGPSTKVVVRAIGPSLAKFGISGALQNPTLDLVNSSGTVLRSNDNWKLNQRAEIEALKLQPSDERESALVQTLAPGNYTAVVRGAGNTTGVGLVEVYNVK